MTPTRLTLSLLLVVALFFSGLYAPLYKASTSAPDDATYLTQTPNTTLTAEQALSLLATGFMRVTTTTGVVTSQVDIALTTDTSGNYVTSVATTSPLTGGAAGTEGGILTLGCVTCGVTGSPLSQFAATTSAQLAGVLSDETGSGLLVFGTGPTLTGGTHTALTGLGIRSTGTGAFDLRLANTENLTVSDKTLTVTLGDTNRTLTMTGNASITGTNTGDQTITLTGDVTGSGTGSFAATIAAQTSATWAGKVSDETGTGLWVFGTSPTITTPTIRTSGTFDTATSTDDRIVVSVTTGGAARFDATLTTADLTAARTVTFPDAASNTVQPLTCTSTDKVSAIAATGVITCTADSGGGGASLDAITAAVASQAGIANANFNIRWNWAKTTDSTNAFMFGESAAATGGTSTAGVPNQVLLRLATLAASTMSPLRVDSRGSHVFSVSETSAQIVLAAGSLSAPTLTSTDKDTGMYFPTTAQVGFTTAAANRVLMSNDNQIGYLLVSTDTSNIPDADMGGVRAALTATASGTTVGPFRASYANAANATVDTLAFTRSRGTITAPIVVTSADDLASLGAYGFVGPTNGFQLAARIILDSGGTISDSATGIGGLIDSYTAIVGAEPALRMRIDNVGHVVFSGTAPTMGACGTSPSVVGNDMSMEVTIGTGGTATSCAITFANAWLTNAPQCVAESDTDIVAIRSVETTTTATFSVTAAFTASSKLEVLCFGRI